ncbi:hypothetical protein HED60_06155 [Planctomycetales bacterium ZRK34]|nr:hypothetical protein HED60_06155 [Planctomycetales bacterium ZRK34]
MNIMIKRNRIVFRIVVAVVVMLIGGWQTVASAAPIASSTTSPALTNVDTVDAELTSFTVGSTVYDTLTHFEAVAVNNNSQPFVAETTPVPGTVTTAYVLDKLSSPYLTQGKANATTVDYDLPTTLAAGHAGLLFMYELNTSGQAGDDVVVIPLAAGSPIGTWSLTINPGDYGPQTALFNIQFAPTNALSDVGVRGVAFTLDDFTGDVGTLTGVDGLRFFDAGAGWDPITAGLALAIPEPASLSLLAMTGLMLIRRRA